MRREAHVIQFLLDQQTVWHAHFPTLRRRTHELIVGYLCTKGRRGTTARQLYGATKEHFQLDDSTVRERIADVQCLDYVHADPPDDRLTGRSILTPSSALSTQYSAYTHALAARLCAAAGAITAPRSFTPPGALTERQQTLVHDTLENYTNAWLVTADSLMESASLSPSRRQEARRRLMTTSYWTLMHRAIEARHAMLDSRLDNGLLADQLAVLVLALNGQGVHTTREHIAALIDLGLFERRRDRVLRIALTEGATRGFAAMLAAFASELIEAAERLATHEPQEEETLRFVTPPETADPTLANARYHLLVTAPPEAARRIPLSPAPLTVGRTNASTVVLPDAQVSRNHCELRLTGGRLMVADMGSTNGTFVDGCRIAGPTPLGLDGELKIGPFVLTLALTGALTGDTDHKGTK